MLPSMAPCVATLLYGGGHRQVLQHAYKCQHRGSIRSSVMRIRSLSVRVPRSLVVAMCIALASEATAQYNTAELSGIVRDSLGAVVPGATVVAVHVASG